MDSPSAEVPDCSTSQAQVGVEEHMAEETDPASTVIIMDLPDEILENIFARVSTYDDLDNVRLTCKRFYFVFKSKLRKL